MAASIFCPISAWTWRRHGAPRAIGTVTEIDQAQGEALRKGMCRARDDSRVEPKAVR